MRMVKLLDVGALIDHDEENANLPPPANPTQTATNARNVFEQGNPEMWRINN